MCGCPAIYISQAKAVKALLAHRLHRSDSQAAKMEWYTIVEGNHGLWTGVSEPYKVSWGMPCCLCVLATICHISPSNYYVV